MSFSSDLPVQTQEDSLVSDYNNAVKFFNEAICKNDPTQYVYFFRNIRPAIENLAIYLTFEAWGNDDEVYDMLNGLSLIAKDRDGYFRFKDTMAKYPPQGKGLVDLFYKVYFCRHPDVFGAKNNVKKKRLRSAIESYCHSLGTYYNIASEIGVHSGPTQLDIRIQAVSCAAFMAGFKDFIITRHIINDSALKLFNRLNSFSIMVNDENSISEEHYKKISRDAQELSEIRKKQREAEQRELELRERIKQLEEKLASKESGSQASVSAPVEPSSPAPLAPSPTPEPPVTLKPVELVRRREGNRNLTPGLMMPIKEMWDVDYADMDYEQRKVIDYPLDESILVSGGPGSGKSVVAMHKARQIAAAGHDVILIVFNKTLYQLMHGGDEAPNFRLCTYHQWKAERMPSADYIIVDDIQDYKWLQISAFIQAKRKHCLFFGDDRQSVYDEFFNPTPLIEEISQNTGMKVLSLCTNYVTPRSVAKVTQPYVGMDVTQYNDAFYAKVTKSLPHFIRCESEDEQCEKVFDVACSNSYRTVGILVPNDDYVKMVRDFFMSRGVPTEYSYEAEADGESQNKVDFSTMLPKVMSYRSAKGLQFNQVIMPFFQGATTYIDRRALYVAMTRTRRSLYVLYSTPTLPRPLDEVPEGLFWES